MRYVFNLVFAATIVAAPAAAQDTELDRGARLFAENCAACHGNEARGDGPAATTLDTAPPDLTRIADRRDGIWPMLEIMSILDGYTQATEPRADMPILSHLTEGPMVDFDPGNGRVERTPERLLDLADYLESIQSPVPERYVP